MARNLALINDILTTIYNREIVEGEPTSFVPELVPDKNLAKEFTYPFTFYFKSFGGVVAWRNALSASRRNAITFVPFCAHVDNTLQMRSCQRLPQSLQVP